MLNTLRAPVKIKLCDFNLINFDEHKTISPLLAFHQAILNASQSKWNVVPPKIDIPASDARARHITELRYLYSQKAKYSLNPEVCAYSKRYIPALILFSQDTSQNYKDTLIKMRGEHHLPYPSVPWNIEMIESLNFLHSKYLPKKSPGKTYEIFLFRRYKDSAFLVNSRRAHMEDEFTSLHPGIRIFMMEDPATGQFFALHP
jgi:hypothetical protein